MAMRPRNISEEHILILFQPGNLRYDSVEKCLCLRNKSNGRGGERKGSYASAFDGRPPQVTSRHQWLCTATSRGTALIRLKFPLQYVPYSALQEIIRAP